ncbi:hypothetical protein C0995_013985 [Termitomyces sp. Mi166|nr:hypothetical protein C0995_013985 [Termitomyces sp. Mi166\
MSLPALVADEAVGYATTDKTFNDVQKGSTVVNGIEIIYDRTNDNPETVVHGKKEGTSNPHALTADEFFVGFFGAVDEDPDAPILRRIGFVVYNKTTGAVTTFGPFPSPSNPPKNVKGFCSLGLIAGFSGTEASNG